MWEIKIEQKTNRVYLTTPEGITVSLPPLRKIASSHEPGRRPSLQLEVALERIRFVSEPLHAGRPTAPVEPPSEDVEQPEAEEALT